MLLSIFSNVKKLFRSMNVIIILFMVRGMNNLQFLPRQSSKSGYNFKYISLRITNEASVPEMRKWSILIVKSNLEWYLHLIEIVILLVYYTSPFGFSFLGTFLVITCQHF